MDWLLQARNLRVTYTTGGRAALALDGVSFAVAEGEAVGVVGPSGAGKTTLGLALLGLAGWSGARVEGTIHWRGQPVERGALAGLRGRAIGYVPQEPRAALNPYLTCGRQVAEALPGGLDHRRRRERVHALLGEVGLEPAVAAQYPHRLSGGMCQRVLLAAALAGDPALLVADEPSASLDALSRQHVLDLLGRVRWERGLALLLISHDRQAIDALCGRVLRVEGGRLVQEAERTGAARMRERACLAPA